MCSEISKLKNGDRTPIGELPEDRDEDDSGGNPLAESDSVLVLYLFLLPCATSTFVWEVLVAQGEINSPLLCFPTRSKRAERRLGILHTQSERS